MLSLPLLQPHQDPSTTLRNPFRPRPDSPPPTSNPIHPNRPAPPPARSHRDEAERKHHAARSPLALLAADEAAISHRKSSIRNFGSYWIRPPGITKTLQAMNEEEAERIEQEEMARQERGLADLQAQQQLAEVRERAAAQVEGGDGEEMEEERDLDAEIPEAEEEEEEEEEEGGMSFNEESMMEGSSQIQTTGGMGGRGVRGRISGMGGMLPTATEENDASFSRDLDVEGEGTSGQYALEMEEAELTGAARDEEALGIVHEEERDLDDSIPEAGAYEHTDTELEDSSESESELHDSFAAQSARRSVRSNAASARAAADDVAEGLRSSMQSASGLSSFGGGGNGGGMGGLQERMRAQARGFLKQCLGPRPSFNDGSYPEPLEIITSAHGQRKAVQSLRTPLSSYGRRVRYCVLEFDDLLDSSSVDARSWDQIARIIQQNYALFAGFVVLHGTDSLAYTSSALSFMLQNLAKPVILTGAQAPMMMLQSDAHDNLLGSLVIAGHFAIPEVCLYFNFKLLRGNRATKVATDDFDAFASPNMLPLATVSSSRTHVRWNLVLRRRTAERGNAGEEQEKLEVQSELDTAPVACLRVFPGMTAQMVDLFLHTEGLRGLILETFGSGNTPGGPDSPFTRVLADAVSRGIVIVNVSQCLSGSVSSIYAPAMTLQRAGVTFGQDMTTEAALTKLAYLLAQPGAEVEGVAEKMSVDIKGELTERTGTFFEHP
ncbi:asparaginase-domain-containing protein [Hortaea werneckii]|nr:asparaginase-domain-containing protein [Hortaea werneckii]